MADARELLARMGPGAIKYDDVPGGTGEGLSGVDVAAALGMVPAGLGRCLLEYRCKCPGDRTRQEREVITSHLVALALGEWARLERAKVDAQLNFHLARVLAPKGREATMESQRRLASLEARATIAAEAAWPKATAQKVPLMVDALLREVCGEVGPAWDWYPTGATLASALGLAGESSYRQHWARVHDWLLAQMRDAEEEAARRLGKAARRAA